MTASSHSNRDGRLHIWLRAVDAQTSEGPGPLLDSCASVVAVRCRSAAKLVEHDVHDVGHPLHVQDAYRGAAGQLALTNFALAVGPQT